MNKISLALTNPNLAAQWHPTKNGTLTPNDVTPGSHKIVWWMCSKGEDHEWQASVKDRNNGRGCGICAGKIVVKSTSLSTLNPKLAKEWHPTKNTMLTPLDIIPGSNKKVWWKCPKGEDHEWQARVNDRNRGDGCPFCSNRKAGKSNSLASVYPELVKEWHPTMNGNLTPFDVVPGSNKKVWWKCSKGKDHEWKTSVIKRIEGNNCPICANKIVVESNCLATKNPKLSKEWHPTKNGMLTPHDVTPGSNKIVWWKCPKGDDHDWQATVYSRNIGNGCSICSNRVIVKSNSLNALNPRLAKEWHPTKNGDLTPNDVGAGTAKKVWWRCLKNHNHEWRSSIVHRNRGYGCPYCGNRQLTHSNCLAVVNPALSKEWHPSKNGELTPEEILGTSHKRIWWKCSKGEDHEWLASPAYRLKVKSCPICSNRKVVQSNCLAVINPALAKEWHPIKNGDLTPKDVVAGSGRKVWWKCLKGKNHEWQTTIEHRTKRNSGCPFCTNPSSVPELRIFSELSTIFVTAQHRVSVNGYEIDVYIPEINVGIEYDGEFWHRQKKSKDLEKNKALNPMMKLIRIREKGLGKLTDTDIELKTADLSIETIKQVLQLILSCRQIESAKTIDKINKYLKSASWIASNHFNRLNSERSHIKYENSVSYLLPNIAKQWHPTKNYPLLPDFFTPGSNRKFWWKCPNGNDHEWQSTITNRSLGKGCPICSGRKTVKSNCLAMTNPKLAAEWHPTMNGELTPFHIGSGSNKKVWWLCSKKKDHEWKANINSRNSGVSCPICANKKVILSNSLAILNPKLANEWHPTKNGTLTPNDVTPGSHKIVWWMCSKGEDHEWQASIKNRNNGIGCAICANKKIVKSNCLSTLNPSLVKEWHPTKNTGLTPEDVHPGSSKKVWWHGKCGHEWSALVVRRAKRGQGCPKCRVKRILETRRKNYGY